MWTARIVEKSARKVWNWQCQNKLVPFSYETSAVLVHPYISYTHETSNEDILRHTYLAVKVIPLRMNNVRVERFISRYQRKRFSRVVVALQIELHSSRNNRYVRRTGLHLQHLQFSYITANSYSVIFSSFIWYLWNLHPNHRIEPHILIVGVRHFGFLYRAQYSRGKKLC